nr:protein AUXIN-REGULATED GENE INVOLVED IN ORGAN SIZE-like [Lolium perenne]
MAMETQFVGNQARQTRRRDHATINRKEQNLKNASPASSYFSTQAFMVLACVAVTLLVLPLVLPPLPPPPAMLLLVPVCMLLLLVVLAFMPSDVRTMASSYL